MTSKILIVTPCLNSRSTIDRTIGSVLSQAGSFSLRYHVQDGGSTDGTVERLEEWSRLLRGGLYYGVTSHVEFSFESSRDCGMYDAIWRSVQAKSPDGDEWLGWINSDDYLNPGALRFLEFVDSSMTGSNLNWVTNGFQVAQDGLLLATGSRALPREVVGEGLCDGIHWDYVQQEGTFFKSRVLADFDPGKVLASFKLAGDWNLWRSMAAAGHIPYEAPWPLGTFVKRDGQLSQRLLKQYLAEIESIVPLTLRESRFLRLAHRGLARNILTVRGGGAELGVCREPLAVSSWPKRARQRMEALHSKSIAAIQESESLIIKDGLVAFDTLWQYPARTEQHAYERVRSAGVRASGTCYLAFPWATLIDHLQTNSGKGRSLQNALAAVSRLTQRYRKVVTVCQHIYQGQFVELLAEAGVTDAFWTHTPLALTAGLSDCGIAFHPFPLFPVQRAPSVIPPDGFPCEVLYSFIGAKPNKYYLTDSRLYIQEELREDPLAVVVSREHWHYDKIVYDHQIFRSATDAAGLVDERNSDVFREVLSKSTFTLCPGGTGPNSIRLWEAVVAGSIPVVLSDDYRPPGDRKLWDAATVCCAEDREAIRRLPDILRQIAADPSELSAKRRALAQLRLLYGPEGFIYDIQKLYIEISSDNVAGTINASRSIRLLRDLSAIIASGEADNDQWRVFERTLKTLRIISRDRVDTLCKAFPDLALAAKRIEAGTGGPLQPPV